MHLLVTCLVACVAASSRGARDADLDPLDGRSSALLGEVLRALWGVARALGDPEDLDPLLHGAEGLAAGHDAAQLIRAIKNAIEYIKSIIAHKIKVKKWDKIHFVKAFGVSTLKKVSSLLEKIKIALKKIPVFLLKLLVAKKLFVVKSKLAPLKYFSDKKKALLGLVFPKFVARAAPHPGLLAGSHVHTGLAVAPAQLWRPSAPSAPSAPVVDSYGRPAASYASPWLSTSLQQPPAASSLQPHAEGAASVWTSSLQLPDSLTAPIRGPGARPIEGVFQDCRASAGDCTA